LNILEEFLDTFPGCLIIVSHDRYFMDRLVEHLFVFEGEGVIRDFPGNYTDFREWEEENAEQKASSSAQPKVEPKPVQVEASVIQEAASPKLKASYKQKQEFKQLNETIAKLEAEKGTITDQITEGTPDVNQLLNWTTRLQGIDEELEELELSWLELSDLDGITD